MMYTIHQIAQPHSSFLVARNMEAVKFR
jgi:hypothetical protein